MRRAARLARLARTFSISESAPGGPASSSTHGASAKPAPHLRTAATLVAATAGLSLPAFWNTAACESSDVGKARSNIAAAFDAVDADTHRAEAGVPRALLPPPPPPPAITVDKDAQDTMTVTITVRRGAATGALLTTLVSHSLTAPLRVTSTPSGGFTFTSDVDGASATLAINAKSGGTLALRAPAALLASDAGATLIETLLRAASSVAGSTTTSDGTVCTWSWSSEGGDGLAGVLGGVFSGEGGGSPAEVLGAVDDFLRRSLSDAGVPDTIFGPPPGGDSGGGSIVLDPRPPPAGGAVPRPPPRGASPTDTAAAALKSMGCTVTRPPCDDAGRHAAFARLAGYRAQRDAIADALLPLTHARECAAVVAAARSPGARPGAGGAPTPRAMLWEGPPGCGKTATAAAAASAAGATLVYVPVEAIVSKWYGEAEQRLAQVFDHARSLAASSGGLLIFFDEIDSLATARGADMHEATRRCLGVLLRSLDGFATGDGTQEGAGGVVAILATNRPGDVDPALTSRCAQRIHFPLPTEPERADIVRLYAAHLGDRAVGALAAASVGLSGRDLRDACESAERRHASAVVRGEAKPGTPPPAALYRAAVEERVAAVRSDAQARRRG